MSDSLLNLLARMTVGSTDPASDYIVGWRNDTSITRHQFIARVSGWRALLAPLSGQHFALYLEDGVEFAAALFGAWYAGKTVWLAADTLACTNDALKPNVDGFLGEFPADCSALQPAFDEISKNASEFLPLNNQCIGLVVHTTGTTGAPLAIFKKLSQLDSEINTLEHLFGEQCKNAEIISTVSHQHIYGLLFKVLWPLTAGRPIRARTQLFYEELAQLISGRYSTRPCVLISSPAYLKRLPASCQAKKINHLQAIFSSGGVLPAAVAQLASNWSGQTPIEIYGSSETGGIAWRQQIMGADASWLAMPDVEWRSSGAEELIEVRSPHLFSDEWIQLADRIEPSPSPKNRRFFLKARRDRIVKIEEKRISLDLIEQRMATSPLVSEAKIIVFNDEPDQPFEQARRQYLAAVVVLSELGKALLNKAGKFALNRQLRNALVGVMEPIAQPRKWRYVDQFPVNAQGKTPQTMLRALFDNESGNYKLVAPQIKLRDRDAQSAEFEVIWPANLLYFEGHFPGAPVLPGVVQVDWAIKTARDCFALPARFHAIRTLKFQHVILPDSSVNLKLDYEAKKGCVNFCYFSAAKQYSSGRILFADGI